MGGVRAEEKKESSSVIVVTVQSVCVRLDVWQQQHHCVNYLIIYARICGCKSVKKVNKKFVFFRLLLLSEFRMQFIMKMLCNHRTYVHTYVAIVYPCKSFGVFNSLTYSPPFHSINIYFYTICQWYKQTNKQIQQPLLLLDFTISCIYWEIGLGYGKKGTTTFICINI